MNYKEKFQFLIMAISVVVLFFSCGGVEKKCEKVEVKDSFFVVDMDIDLSHKDELCLSSLADSLSYVPLETTQQSLISEIKSLKATEKYFYLLTENSELMLFDKSGKFHSRIGRKGKGPKEYYDVIHFDTNDSLVYILDYAERIAVYTTSGKFIRYIKIAKQASRIFILNDDRIVYFVPDSMFEDAEDSYGFAIINQEGKVLKKMPATFQRDNMNNGISNHFVLINFSNQHSITIKEAFNDTLYRFDTDSLTFNSYAYINLGQHKIDFEKNFEQVAWASHNMRISDIIETSRSAFIVYTCMCVGNNSQHLGVFDKSKKQFYTLIDDDGEENIINDIDGVVNLKPETVFKDQLISFVFADQIVENDSLMKLMDKPIEKTANPVIVLARLKK